MGCFQPGDFAVIAGSTTPVLAVLDRAVIDPEGCLYASTASLPGQWTLEGNADSTGLSYRWLRNLLYTDPVTGRVMDHAYARMEADAAEVPAGAGGMSAYVGIGIRNVEKGMSLDAGYRSRTGFPFFAAKRAAISCADSIKDTSYV